MGQRLCRLCGRSEEDHCAGEFIEMPDGCRCAPGTWETSVPAVCAEYQGNGTQDCTRCEHDVQCHPSVPHRKES